MADVKSVVADPDFQHLSLAGQKQVLAGIDPQFQGLSDEGFKSFLSHFSAPSTPHADAYAQGAGFKNKADLVSQIDKAGVQGGPVSAIPLSGIPAAAAGWGAGEVAKHLGGGTVAQTIAGLLTAGTVGGVQAGITKLQSLPKSTATEAVKIIAKGLGRYIPVIKEALSVGDLVSALRTKTPGALAEVPEILRPTVTGGRPVAPSEPSPYPPGDPNAEPGPGLWQRNGLKGPRSVDPILPERGPERYGSPYREAGPGFSGTELPAPTGKGGTSQTPLPAVPVLRAPVEGIPHASEYTFSGGNQYQIPGTKGVMASEGPTGPLPKAPGSPTAGLSLSERDQAALKVGGKILDSQDTKSRTIANFWKQQGIDPTQIDETTYAAHEKRLGFGKSRDAASSLARTRQVFGTLGESPVLSPSSNNEAPTTSVLEDTLKKSIKKVESQKGIKASKGTTPKGAPKVTITAPVPTAPPVEEGGVFTYGGSAPTWEFKRLGSGSWAQRDFGSDQPFASVGGPQALDLEDAFTNSELKRK